MRMIDIIKQAGAQAVEAGNPVHIRIGTVTRTEPLEVFVDQRFSLTSEFLIVTDATEELTIEINGSLYTVRPGLQAGDKVALIRVQGGQQYVVMGRVRDT
ncbi:hypothetical protein IJ21_00320 [Paenibacillus sp. 32O-W]|jgi:Protein of unknown function (DUF2577).|uniref:DUF2577 domain-containing protein n=1 Tax=Paenibacillus sp. 32O-W TaxID=1695218 RepID=UPI00071FCE0C|nr:DUF2577 domain-containing protein [Paenibacillus sp. 32O-W]ALS25487.1 hypothetical protein IJ21_00320 [Paenibacillus sp. 32O-W]